MTFLNRGDNPQDTGTITLNSGLGLQRYTKSQRLRVQAAILEELNKGKNYDDTAVGLAERGFLTPGGKVPSGAFVASQTRQIFRKTQKRGPRAGRWIDQARDTGTVGTGIAVTPAPQPVAAHVAHPIPTGITLETMPAVLWAIINGKGVNNAQKLRLISNTLAPLVTRQ